MNTHADKEHKYKRQAVTDVMSGKKSTGESAYQYVDNRPEALAQRKLQEAITSSTQVREFTRIQPSAQNTHSPNNDPSQAGTDLGVIQRAINVTAKGAGTTDVSIKADGTAEEFEGGDSAIDHGWNNVTSYSGRVYIDQSYYKTNRKGVKQGYTRNLEYRAGPYDNDYRVAQAGHVLAKQNGGYGSDKKNVFAQDGGVNNGPWRTKFENPMRKALKNCDIDDAVSFRVGLHGEEDITSGPLEKESSNMDADHEDVFDTTDESESD